MSKAPTGYSRPYIMGTPETHGIKNHSILVLEGTLNWSFNLYSSPYPNLKIEFLALEEEILLGYWGNQSG